MTTENPPNAAESKRRIVAGLRRYDQHLVQFGRQMHEFYPPDRIPPDVMANIVVPVPVHLAMMLFGLATIELVAAGPVPKSDEMVEETPT
jgi:hypothetical protein